MTAPLALLSDLEARLGPRVLGPADAVRAEALIADATNLVRSRTGKTWLNDDDAVSNPTVTTIVVNCALRAFLNPGGYVSESTGDWAGSRRDEDAVVGVYLTDAEVATLQQLGSQTRGLWSQPTTRGAIETGQVLVDVAGSDKPIPVERLIG